MASTLEKNKVLDETVGTASKLEEVRFLNKTELKSTLFLHNFKSFRALEICKKSLFGEYYELKQTMSFHKYIRSDLILVWFHKKIIK